MLSTRHLLSSLLACILVLTVLPAAAQKVIATVPVGVSAYSEAVNTVTNKIYVANACGNDPTCQSNGTLTVIDGATFSTTTVTVGVQPYSVAVNQVTNKIYVANSCGNDPSCSSPGSVTVIDGTTLSTTTVNVGASPYPVAVNSTTNKIYVATCGNDPTCNSGGTVAVIDGATLSTTMVAVGQGSHSIAVNPVTNKIYVADAICGGFPNCPYSGDVTVIDGATLSITMVGVGISPDGVAVNPVTNKIYVTNYCGSDPLCASNGTVTVIDGATLSTTTVGVGIEPLDVAVNSVTNKIYAVNSCGDFPVCNPSHQNWTVTVIDGSTLSTTSVPVGIYPYSVAINQVTNKIYVTNTYPPDAPTVSVIDGATLATTMVGVGIHPDRMAINEVTNRIYVANICGDGPCTSSTVSVIDGTPPTALQFVSLPQPCRAVDTRSGGGPIQGGTSQDFIVSGSAACGTLPSAAAYSMNVTVVPQTTLGYLTVWPTGQPQPLASTLNSLDGRVKANAAIMPAGTAGKVSVYATDTTQVIIDVNGYFAPVTTSTLAFYPLTPCRVADTRNPGFPQGLGPPSLTGGVDRVFPILSAPPACNVPPNAGAYSLNFTVVPHGSLGFLTVWPTGGTRPTVSTLNDVLGQVIANAAIVVGGTSGDVSAYATGNTDLIIDINGYFAPAGQGGLSLYGVSPCRVIDTRRIGTGDPFTGTLTPHVDVVDTGCAASSVAQAYVFNASVVPQGSLGYLTLWPDGLTQPVVSTLNATDGSITSNMAIVPTGNGFINASATNGFTQLLLDLSSYFAP